MYTYFFNAYGLDIDTPTSICGKYCLPVLKVSLQCQYFDFVSTTASLHVDYVKSKYGLCIEIFSTERHYLSQTEIKVDISSPYSLNKMSVYHPPSAIFTPFPTYFMNVEIETVLGACDVAFTVSI